MTADEAREISAKAIAIRDLRNYLQTIERAARDGNFEQSFGALSERQENQFKALGYKVGKKGQNSVVSWSHLPATT